MPNRSIISALRTVYPEVDWKPWKFSKALSNSWDDVNNQRSVCDEAAKQLGIQNPEDWYKVSAAQLLHSPARQLLQHHSHSVIKMLKSAYPEVKWKPWQFKKTISGFWKEQGNREEFLQDFIEKQGIQNGSDWNCILHVNNMMDCKW
jgi:hypothetical protein